MRRNKNDWYVIQKSVHLFTDFFSHDRARAHHPSDDDTDLDETDSGILISIALGSI
jgi:hypothetical protein